MALRRRPGRGLLAGLWEYPNELSPAGDALARWGIAPASLRSVGMGKHIFTHIEWRMAALAAEASSHALPEGWVWADRAALAREYAVPNAFQPFQGAVEERLGHF